MAIWLQFEGSLFEEIREGYGIPRVGMVYEQLFSAYYFYAGITKTINFMPFRRLWSKLALQELVPIQSYFTRAQKYSSYIVQNFAVSFLKLCAYLRPVFLRYTHHINTAERLTRAFLNNRSGCRKKSENVSVLPRKSHAFLCVWNGISWKQWLRSQKALVSFLWKW